jgi:CO/xanthine dehydrogenase FAD-binding subunit
MQTVFGSHAAIPPFRLLRPERAEEAAAALHDGAAFLAGGVDLVPALRAGRRATALIALGGLRALAAVERDGAVLRVGAGLTYAAFAADPAVGAALPDLVSVFARVANVRVRHAATLGGNLMARNPAYDLLPALLALDARLVFLDAAARRLEIGAAESPWPEALLTAIEIPLAAERRFVLDRAYKPVLSLALAIERRGAALVGRAAVGCAHAVPVVLPLELGGIAERRSLADGAAEIAQDFAARLPAPADDWIASAGYRRRLAAVLLARALRAAAS